VLAKFIIEKGVATALGGEILTDKVQASNSGDRDGRHIRNEIEYRHRPYDPSLSSPQRDGTGEQEPIGDGKAEYSTITYRASFSKMTLFKF
jgi:hypothetical protein